MLERSATTFVAMVLVLGATVSGAGMLGVG